MTLAPIMAVWQVEIFVDVDEVDIVGVSASSRVNISAMATTDEASVMYILVRYKKI